MYDINISTSTHNTDTNKYKNMHDNLNNNNTNDLVKSNNYIYKNIIPIKYLNRNRYKIRLKYPTQIQPNQNVNKIIYNHSVYNFG